MYEYAEFCKVHGREEKIANKFFIIAMKIAKCIIHKQINNKVWHAVY